MPLPPNKENKKSSSFLQKLTHFGGGGARAAPSPLLWAFDFERFGFNFKTLPPILF